MSDSVTLHELLYLAAERAQYENKRNAELLEAREAQIEYWRECQEHLANTRVPELEERILDLEADNALLGQQRDALKEAQQTLKKEAVKEALEEARKAQFHLKELLTNTLKANDKLLTERDTIAEARKAAVKERDEIAKKHAYLLTTLKGLAGETAPASPSDGEDSILGPTHFVTTEPTPTPEAPSSEALIDSAYKQLAPLFHPDTLPSPNLSGDPNGRP